MWLGERQPNFSIWLILFKANKPWKGSLCFWFGPTVGTEKQHIAKRQDAKKECCMHIIWLVRKAREERERGLRACVSLLESLFLPFSSSFPLSFTPQGGSRAYVEVPDKVGFLSIRVGGGVPGLNRRELHCEEKHFQQEEEAGWQFHSSGEREICQRVTLGLLCSVSNKFTQVWSPGLTVLYHKCAST